MLEKLAFLEEKYEDLSRKIGDPEIINEQNQWRKLVKEHSDLEEVVMKYRQYRSAQEELDGANEILRDKDSDEELKELAKMEIGELEEQVNSIEEDLKILLLPKDPNDDKNVIIEIRAGAGDTLPGTQSSYMIFPQGSFQIICASLHFEYLHSQFPIYRLQGN